MASAVVGGLMGLLAAVLVPLITGLLQRPKNKAEAKASQIGGDVNISTDAREWALRADARAQRAEERADELSVRLDELDDKFAAAIDLIRAQNRVIVGLGGHPPPVPLSLIPPLGNPV